MGDGTTGYVLGANARSHTAVIADVVAATPMDASEEEVVTTRVPAWLLEKVKGAPKAPTQRNWWKIGLAIVILIGSQGASRHSVPADPSNWGARLGDATFMIGMAVLGLWLLVSGVRGK